LGDLDKLDAWDLGALGKYWDAKGSGESFVEIKKVDEGIRSENQVKIRR